MAVSFPPNSLDPGSKPWSRKVESEVRAIHRKLDTSDSWRRNSADGLTATLGKLSDQVRELAETQATLATVVTDLQEQQVKILGLLNTQVVPAVAPTITTEAWPIDNNYGVKAITSIAVPAGYNRALVYASGSVSMVNNGEDTWGTNLFAYIDIAGNGGQHQQCWLGGTTSGRAVAVVVPLHSRTMSGLGGGSINLSMVAGLGSTTGIATDLRRAQIGGFALFLR